MSGITDNFARLCRVCILSIAAAAAVSPAGNAAGVLTVAMTAGDVAVTTGTPDQGFEGFRFVGWSLYDALVRWDLSRSDVASDIVPGLATSWDIDPTNPSAGSSSCARA